MRTQQATAEANARAAALKARLEAAEAARLSQLISEDVRRKEELRAERARLEREKEKEGRVEFLQLDANGDRKLSMSLKIAEEEKEATVKLGLMSGGGQAHGLPFNHPTTDFDCSSRLDWTTIAGGDCIRTRVGDRWQRLRRRYPGTILSHPAR